MEFLPTALPGVVLIKPRLFRDERGFFCETWHQQKFAAAGITQQFVQDNHSHSVRHTLRGMHFQIQQPQGKLVRVVRGAVFDAVIDLRRDSPHFGKWFGAELSAENHLMLWVPPGFAHGYLTLSERADFLYRCTDFYAPQYERAIRWDDPEVGISWPVTGAARPLLSPKDAIAPAFRAAELDA